ncbi:hypothetical protein I6N95_15710 [Vagococcus sp. BWB3-3]|uniref:Uncharacterized protein n=1 Tax=Vagococcus allomyrinae TaxID=2794353 RepID=A0A940SVL9_9ENTE|nr:hypothetical protein [Vagococcus allomyrinae]MBP1042465.1 hypothetical protein [Vagococcus allomyrinae]
MRAIKKEYGLLIVASLPIINLVMQQKMPSLVVNNQAIGVLVNIFSVSIIVFYTVKKLLDKDKTELFLQRLLMLFGFAYSMLILLLLCSLLVFRLQN